MRHVIALAALFVTAPAAAQDLILNAGTAEVVGVPNGDHFGVYPYVGPSLAIPTEHVVLIPGVAVEYSPEFDRWGLVGTLVADFSIHDRVGIDLTAAIVHDQSGAVFDEAVFFGGGGGGVSVFLGKWTISPYALVLRGVNVPGTSITPGINVGYAL